MRTFLPLLALLALAGCRDHTAPEMMARFTGDADRLWVAVEYGCLGSGSEHLTVDPPHQ